MPNIDQGCLLLVIICNQKSTIGLLIRYWCMFTLHPNMYATKRIALNFRGSKFSRMAVCEYFVEIISLSNKPCARYTRNVVWMSHTSKFYLIRTHTVVRARACSCQQSNAYFEGISLESIPCRYGSIAPGCCPSTLLHVKTVYSLRVKIFYHAALQPCCCEKPIKICLAFQDRFM